MPPIPPRTQDVIAGGGSFSACLERAIRRPPSPPILGGEGGSLPNINEVAEETTPPPTEEGGDTININNVDELLGQDWSSHHASYHLLQECLAFFSRRRLAVKSAMRDNNDTTNKPQQNNNNSKTLSEHELTTLIHTYAKKAPNLNDPNVMEYASQRALGTTPPRGYNHRKTANYNSKRSNIFTRSLRCGSCFTEEEFMRDEENSFASGSGSSSQHYVEMMDNTTTTANPLSPPTGGVMLTEAEVIKHLSFIERVELSAVLDSEVERAAMFYRHRLAELAPNREDGEVLPKKFKPSGGGNNNSGGGVVGKHHHTPEFNELLAGGSSDQDDDLIEPSSNRVIDTLSFNDLGSEILELHAFITTNIIVVRQILIRYDAFVRSLGGSPMSSWYQKSRRLRKNGRSSDFRDLTFHSKLKRLTLAYIGEYKQNLEDYENDEDGEGFLGVRGNGGGRNRRRRRFRGFANQFHKLVDAAEEIKKRQRAKWRQPAMNVSSLDFGEGCEGFSSLHDCGAGEEGGVEAKVAPATPMERVQTPPLRPAASSDSYLETPLSERTGAEVVPPLQPPDYASLRSNPDIGEDIEYQVYIFKCVQSKTQRSIEKTYTGRASGVRDNFITTLREYFLLGSAMDNLSLMPEYLIMRGKSLKSSLLVVAQWRDARKANLYGIKREPEGVNESWFGGFRGLEPQCLEPQPPSSSTNTSFSLVLNILSCFLYMMNYYIVGPSSVEYANALGAKDAMSGLIIGAMPWAALISAVLFSIWSNKSYRSPLLASGVLLIAGNILYSSAYRQQSIVMALCGRFLTGLGGPRSMNRRYIADTTPLAYRTAANAAFGTATALGAAVGPAIAVLLDTFDFEVNLPLYGSFYFNGMTGPGYLMSVLWIIYLILTICMFREPVRSGLIEQVEKEREIERSNSNIQSLPTIQTYPSEYEMSPLERRDSTVTNYERGDSVLTNFERDDSVRNYDRLTPFQRDDSVRSNFERGDSAVTNFDRDDSIRYYRSSSSRTNEVNDCAACPVDNRVGFERSASEQSTPNKDGSFWSQIRFVARHMTPAVHLCMFLIFSKQFTVENLISGASMVTKNRYGWELKQVGALGTVVGCLTIPISVFVGWISQYREDGVLMLWLITCATVGMALLVDPTDFVSADTDTYNEGNIFAVGPGRYYAGYLLVFCSVQAFDGVVGSVLSKVIPTALAAGTLNSGLLATIVGTLGRALGDAFITAVGYINLRQVQNLLFVPSFVILVADLLLVFMKRETLTA